MKVIFHTFINVAFPQRLGQNIGDQSVLDTPGKTARFGVNRDDLRNTHLL